MVHAAPCISIFCAEMLLRTRALKKFSELPRIRELPPWQLPLNQSCVVLTSLDDASVIKFPDTMERDARVSCSCPAVKRV